MKGTTVKVFEIIPPMVATELGKDSVDEGEAHMGIPPSEVAEAALHSIERNEYEIAVGEAANLVSGAKTSFDHIFKRMNSWD